jgi:kumamolisin
MAFRSVATCLSVSLFALASTGALANKSVVEVPQLVKGAAPTAPLDITDSRPHHFTAFLNPRGADVAGVSKYFASYGFKVTYSEATRSLGLTGTYAQAQAAGHFNYRMVGRGQAAFPLPNRKPSFDAGVAKSIDHTTFYIGPRMMPQNHPVAQDTNSGIPSLGYGPPDYAKFYDITPVYTAGIYGQKETVDIAACGKVFNEDIQYFSEKYNLPYAGVNATDPTVTIINVENSDYFYYGLEPTLDVERVHGTAPKASVRLFFVPDCTFGQFEDMFAAIAADQTANPAVALTISYGQYEAVYNYLCTDLGNYNPNYCNYLSTTSGQPAGIAAVTAKGVTVFSSSGDDGGFLPDVGIGGATTIHADVLYPASDPNVISVGGTTILPTATGFKEWAWSGNTGSGGGVSSIFTIPSWQTLNYVAKTAASTTFKNIPDVSDNADPYSGAAVAFCVSSGCGYPYPVVSIGGTSAASPTFAGFLALIDNARHAGGLKPPANVGKVLVNHHTDFNDITVGSNGPYNAGVGYDNVTGLGTPDVAALVKDLE